MSNPILFRWEVEALLLHPRAPTCTRPGDRYSCKRVMAPSLCGRWQKGHGENVLSTHAISSLLCTRSRQTSCSFEFGLDQRQEKVCLVGCLCLWFPLQRVDRPATVHLKIAQDSKNTDLKWSLIAGTTRCSGNRSEIFQWAGEKSYKKSKNKYSQLHPHRTCFIFYSQGGIKTNKYIQPVYIKVLATLCNIYDIIFKHFWIVWNIHD